MHAVVLVGGFGTRLRPLTNTVPKSMLPIAHVPLIVRLIAQLERGGVAAGHAGVGVPARAVPRSLPRRPLRRRGSTTPSSPSRSTRPGHPLRGRAAGIDDTFVVMNGDVLTDLSIADLVVFHRDVAQRRRST